MKKCDQCGCEFTGQSFPVYGEQYNRLDLEICEKCYQNNLGLIEEDKTV